MKNLVLSTLIAAAASQAAGCIITSDDDGGGLGDIRVTWNLKSTDVSQRDPQHPNISLNPDVTAGCPAGADTVMLFALPVGAPPSTAFKDAYSCTDGSGVIGDLEPGQYTVWAQITDHPGTTKFAESFSQDLTVFAGNVTSSPFDIYVDRGFFFLGWTLNRGGAQSCASIPNHGVSVLSTDGGGAAVGFEDLIDCEAGEGQKTISQPLPVRPAAAGMTASYTVALSLLNALDQSIGESADIPSRTFDNYGGAVNDLGVIQINVR